MERMVNQSEVTEVLTASAVALFVQSLSISDTPFSTLNTTRVFWCGDLRIVDHCNGREYRNHEVRSRARELGVSLAHLCEHLDDVDHPRLSHWEFAELPFFMIECDQGYVSATRLNNQLLDINEDWFLADERA